MATLSSRMPLKKFANVSQHNPDQIFLSTPTEEYFRNKFPAFKISIGDNIKAINMTKHIHLQQPEQTCEVSNVWWWNHLRTSE